MRIAITLDIADELGDPDHPTGLTEQGHQQVFGALAPFGDDIDIRKADR